MNRVESLAAVGDLTYVAKDIFTLLNYPENADIVMEFPGSVARNSTDEAQAYVNLVKTAANCASGICRHFVTFSGMRAVGLSVVQIADSAPDGIDPSWPNVSGFICSPYRNRGLGKLSLATRLSYVDNEFGGKAWTKVKKENAASQAIVTASGFELVREEDNGLVYLYING